MGFSQPVQDPHIFDVQQFGACGTGTGKDTVAIQRAIDACALQGGGTVRFPRGIYLTGTLILKSNITLYMAADAVLLGSTDKRDYADDIDGAVEAPNFNKCLLYAKDCCSITLAGSGAIDGQGGNNTFPCGIENERPMLLRMVNCRKVAFHGLTLRNAAAWCCHLVDCEDIHISHITLDSHVNVNNDGLDFDGCRNVFISDSRFHTADDSICLKSTSDRIGSHFTISNCILRSDTAAIKLGTSSRGGYRNVVVNNCIMHDCKLGAIKLLMMDGGILENISINNIVMDQVEGPLFIRLGRRGNRYETPREMNFRQPSREELDNPVPAGILRRVRISNVQATVTTSDKTKSGVLITGVPGSLVEDVQIENMSIRVFGGGTGEDRQIVVAEDEARYPEQYFFGVLPASVFFIRHASGICLRNIRIVIDQPDDRPVAVAEDVEHLQIKEMDVHMASKARCLLRLTSVNQACIGGLYTDHETVSPVVHLDGGDCRNIRLIQEK
ncbi:MAG: pehX [Paenibacillaceae bacterium]|jgi:polygalacturonase|nr:pehX [Paenibacillaceae bacterium]